MTRPSVEPLLSMLRDDIEIARKRFVTARREMASLQVRAQKARDRTEERADQALEKIPPVTLDTLREALRRERALTPRERRAVMRYWWILPQEALKFCREESTLIPTLRKEVFRSFRHYKADVFDELVRHVARFEHASGNRRGGIGFDKWVNGGPPDFARRLNGEPEEWASEVRRYDLLDRWDYAQFTFAERLSNLISEKSAGGAFDAIMKLPSAARARLFPPEKGSQIFWESPAAPLIVGAWLNGAIRSDRDAAVIDGPLVRAMRDPRVVGEADPHWLAVKNVCPTGYQALAQRLSRADIEFFFGILGKEGRKRGEFWLEYVRAIQKTDCYLCPEDEASARARATEPGVDLALARARKARGVTSVFVMDFGDFVAVEFSQKGNATYIYSQRGFQDVNMLLDDRHGVAPEWFKSKAKAEERLGHHDQWQSKFSDVLASKGVFPATDKRR